MEELDEREGLVSGFGVEPAARRNVRRRLVQSTLFPHKSEAEVEPDGDGDKEGNDDGVDEEFCGSQGKRTRKQKARTTPKNGASKKLAKEKSPRRLTPKKQCTRNGSVASNQIVGPNVSPPVTNLRLEAKLRAEEDSRMSAGKQIHPFFSLWKAGKRNQEGTEAATNRCRGQRRERISTIGPIHVYDRSQDSGLCIDWKNWTFCKETSTSDRYDQQHNFNSLFEQSAKEFGVKELPTASLPDISVIKVEEYDQCVIQSEDIAETSPGVLTTQEEEKSRYIWASDGAEEVLSSTICFLVSPLVFLEPPMTNGHVVHSFKDGRVDEVVFLSSHAGGAAEFFSARQSISCQESGQPHNSLWIDKYQPKCATEVCGNAESVKLISDWLSLWRERGFQPTRDSTTGNEREMQNADYSCYGSDSDAENIDVYGEHPKNVLLIIGPVGSGKSAAIHACAKEQGFKILESNASESRSGAIVRQKFGEALESYGLTRSLESPLNASIEQSLTPTGAMIGSCAIEELVEVTPVTDKETQAHGDRANLKPLILFEDIDICFPEDRGLVSAIQQIAEKAKGPVVLTTNERNHCLPDNLDRLEICFAMPSTRELLSQLSLVCASEYVNVHPGSLEQLVRSSHGDIRKAIMHLQFWFQSRRYRRAKKAKNACDPILFDLDAGHMLLPRILPWQFPSQLSQFVETEIAKSLSMAEENSTSVEVFVEEVENEEMLNKLWRCDTGKNSLEAKKAAMLRRNSSYEDCDDLEDILNTPCELRNSSLGSLSFSRLNNGRMRNVVLSSDSEDESLNAKHIFISSSQKDNGGVLKDMQKDTISLADTLIPSMGEISEASHYLSETSKSTCMNDVSQSVDVSLVPESSYVPETEIDNGAALSHRAISCAHFDGVEVSMSEDFSQKPASIDTWIDRFHLVSNCTRHASEVIAESSHRMEVEECVEEYEANSLRQYQITDECSRIDFDKITKAVQKLKVDTPRDSVQEAWRKLRSSHVDLKPYMDSELIDAPQVLDLTYQISNALSEAELFYSRCQKIGYLEPVKDVSGQTDTFGISDELKQMVFVVEQQRFCFYAKEIAATVSGPSSSSTDELNLESLGITIDTVMGGGWTEDEASLNYTSISESCFEMKPETCKGLMKSQRRSRLLDMIKSVVPTRSYLALKGDAFHEYVSFLGRISRSDASNLSETIQQSKRRRSQARRHYLSTGSLTLSPEDISLLGQHSMHRETPF